MPKIEMKMKEDLCLEYQVVEQVYLDKKYRKQGLIEKKLH
ncbi:hypothetical protein OCHUTO_0253 [Orientia chuto str. Dubai]|uniref:Uncharacterized protein n=1 Tax=Orientia chuto str. Dubai TaxID=1359168 RepID=A0A0F3MN86_9RICK|nr:hypothetical protein OCHUTO_0253 [Orientia chuto str. Dubai]